jgi:thimet oligopeptidase
VQVYTAENKTLLGTLLLDLYPRQGKYTHACQMTIIPTFMKNDEQQHPGLAVVLANFPAPSSEKPALLKLGDVRTFFHEFGHALHALLGATQVVSLSGTNTKTDFVELPSQLLEEWLWDKQILKRVSSHYQTGLSLPDDLIDRIVQLKNFSTGYFVQRQAYLAQVALSYYNAETEINVQHVMQQLYTDIITHVAYPKEAHFYASFGHLYGYGAKYYSYLWSNVFAQDLFAAIKKEGLTNQTVGKKYIASILKPGGTQNPTDMLVAFLGRKPRSEAFFAAMGL